MRPPVTRVLATMRFLVVIVLISIASLATAQPSSAPATTSAVGPEIPLPDIPPLDPIDASPPRAEATKGLAARLDELVETNVAGPLDEPSFGFLLADLDGDMVPAIRQRLSELREQIDGAAAERLLERARDTGKKALRKAKKDDDGDWLVFMLALGKEDSDTWRDAVQLYGMLRMLEIIGTTPAVRQMVESYSYFGELVRIDLQRALTRLGDRSVAALIEARQHDARKVRGWASRQLDALGRAIPGEAVSTTDAQVLADVLRAFGRTRDLDATRVILSFTSSERAQLREASREAIGAIGEPATWHLKDSYNTLTGEKAPRDWDWKRTAREIFRLHDRARLQPVYTAMEDGTKALAEKKYGAAVEAFDRVLARAPLFPRRSEMPPAYQRRAEELAAEGKTAEAIVLLRKAQRLAPDTSHDASISAELAYLEAKQLVDAGTPDPFLIERAIELAPDDERARALRDGLATKAEERRKEKKKVGAAIGVGLLALVILILLVRVRRPKKRSDEAADPRPVEPSETEASEAPAPEAGLVDAHRAVVVTEPWNDATGSTTEPTTDPQGGDETPTVPRDPGEA
jgi:tetratricopeptide (TPR) repeat protein